MSDHLVFVGDEETSLAVYLGDTQTHHTAAAVVYIDERNSSRKNGGRLKHAHAAEKLVAHFDLKKTTSIESHGSRGAAACSIIKKQQK